MWWFRVWSLKLSGCRHGRRRRRASLGPLGSAARSDAEMPLDASAEAAPLLSIGAALGRFAQRCSSQPRAIIQLVIDLNSLQNRGVLLGVAASPAKAITAEQFSCSPKQKEKLEEKAVGVVHVHRICNRRGRVRKHSLRTLARGQLTYAQVKGSGLANRCPTVESNGSEVPVAAGPACPAAPQVQSFLFHS